ncbi:AAA family ATPase [Paenibacillus chartarius]|uniref:AAA family ATPase n=1 Tax=Paenibacillus chartarius TaxID=747481 RepID=A0ABV6DPC9_9BACL
MGTFQDAMNRMAASEFTGRSFELELFRQLLEGNRGSPAGILNLHGTGGIGKSTLLERYRVIAENGGAAYAGVDMRECMGDSRTVLRVIAEQLHDEDEDEAPAGYAAGETAAAAARIVNREAEKRTVVLAFDQYEEAGGLDCEPGGGEAYGRARLRPVRGSRRAGFLAAR